MPHKTDTPNKHLPYCTAGLSKRQKLFQFQTKDWSSHSTDYIMALHKSD